MPLVKKLGNKVTLELAARGGKPVESARKIREDMDEHKTQILKITAAWVGDPEILQTKGGRVIGGGMWRVGWRVLDLQESATGVAKSITQIDNMIKKSTTEITKREAAGLKRYEEEAPKITETAQPLGNDARNDAPERMPQDLEHDHKETARWEKEQLDLVAAGKKARGDMAQFFGRAGAGLGASGVIRASGARGAGYRAWLT